MSKGDKPPKLPPPPSPSDPEINPDPPPPKCWTFNPMDTTPITRGLEVGGKVFGTFLSNRVYVTSPKGAIGYVPDSDAQEMIASAAGTNKRLIGQVLNNETEILIELCLV